MPTRNAYVILIAIVVSLFCHQAFRTVKSASVVGQAIDLINRDYYRDVDEKELLDAAMVGVVSGLDPFSEYLTVDKYQDLQDDMKQEFAGIGILVDQPAENEPVRVVTPLVGSPALEAGLMPNDLIVAVDRSDVSTSKLDEVSEKLRGEPGSTVEVVVRRGDDEKEVKVQRARIAMESVVGDYRDEQNNWVFRLQSHPEIAYVRVKKFGEKTVSELQTIFQQLDSSCEGLVLDLRDNGGGLLDAACIICDMFLEKGDIVSTRLRGGKVDEMVRATPGTEVPADLPMAILINSSSASASEIVAACLQDDDRALIVGSRSFGKGTVQQVIPLEYGRSALRLTIARYFRPSGVNIHREKEFKDEDIWGVTPNDGFEMPLTDDEIITLGTRWRDASFPFLTTMLQERDQAQPDGASGDNSQTNAENDGSGDTESGEVTEADLEDVATDPENTDAEVEARKLRDAKKAPELNYDPHLRAAVIEMLGL